VSVPIGTSICVRPSFRETFDQHHATAASLLLGPGRASAPHRQPIRVPAWEGIARSAPQDSSCGEQPCRACRARAASSIHALLTMPTASSTAAGPADLRAACHRPLDRDSAPVVGFVQSSRVPAKAPHTAGSNMTQLLAQLIGRCAHVIPLTFMVPIFFHFPWLADVSLGASHAHRRIDLLLFERAAAAAQVGLPAGVFRRTWRSHFRISPAPAGWTSPNPPPLRCLSISRRGRLRETAAPFGVSRSCCDVTMGGGGGWV